ncbi:hypothetical protein EDD37DRAFT_581368, partial [Exophiala viscosa]|uniref:uncharacterized protein n=1 Tax=Exophiala viscosa TaxID=2486360 RepID=UPI00219784C0
MPTVEIPGGCHGERLIPHIVDAYAHSNPERAYALVPLYLDGRMEYRTITMRDLSNAVNRAAWWLKENLGQSTDFETLAYMGPADIRYGIFFIAAIKVGYKFLVPSARNSVSGNVSLFAACQCKKIVCGNDIVKRLGALESQILGLQHFVVEELEDLLSSKSPNFPYNKTHAEAVKDPVLICHTSGSTGAPKPIVLPNGAFSVIDNQRKLSKIEGRQNMDYSLFDLDGNYFVNTFPGFHVGGMVAMAALPIYYNTAIVMVPHDQPANGQLLAQVLSRVIARAIFSPPTVIEELLETTDGSNKLAKLDFIMYGGGPLSPMAGQSISESTLCVSVIGSTECGIIPARVPPKEAWNYFEFHPEYKAEMVHIADDIYELTIPNPPQMAWIHTIYHTFPDVEVWHTNDHYKQHPENCKLFTFRGRGDDVIVLSNGEKFQPVTAESVVQSHPDVDGALVVGTGRFQPVLIIEPRKHPDDPERLINSIWPAVEAANKESAAHGRIFKGKVLLTSPEKPFVRTSKGTIIRARSAALYEGEVEELFAEAAKNPDIRALSQEEVQSFDALRKAVGQYIRPVIPDLSPDSDGDVEDFFSFGLDSVRTLELSNGLRALLRPHVTSNDLTAISSRLIYAYPSIETLSRQLCKLLPSQDLESTDNTSSERSTRMAAMLERYADDLPNRSPLLPENKDVSLVHVYDHGQGLCIALTGSTGSLGSQLLCALLADRRIGSVVCLNRAYDGQQRTLQRLGELRTTIDMSKVEFYKVDFESIKLGLQEDTYHALLARVDVIVHNAWRVDFNQALQSFEPQIRGVRHLIDWAANSGRRPRLSFVSSISSVAQWSDSYPNKQEIPESSLTEVDYNVALPMGYGESKHVAERLLAIAADVARITVDVLRLGQVAGPISPNAGSWNRSEWFPALIETSKSTNRIPDRLPEVNWVPVDVLAGIIVDLLHHEHGGCKTFNLLNPHTRPWEELTSTIQRNIGGNVVPFKAWIQDLQSVDSSDPSEVKSKPALKILDWFVGLEQSMSSGRSQPSFRTVNGIEASRIMAELQPVSDAWMEHWLK